VKHPFTKNRTSIIVYTFVWLVIALIQTFTLIYVLNLSFGLALLDSLTYNIILFALGLSLWYPTNFIDFENSSTLTILINHSVGAVITTFLWVGIGYLFLSSVVEDNTYLDFLSTSVIWRSLIGLLFYISIG